MKASHVFPIAVLVLLCLTLPWGSGEPWAAPGLQSPLGRDEFGRDILLMGVLSMGASIAKGIVLTSVAFAFGIAIGSAVAAGRSEILRRLLQLITAVAESIPLPLWILVAVSAVPGLRALVLFSAFTIAASPTIANTVAGELSRLQGEPFIEAARLLGVSRARLLLRHYAPNSASVLMPLFFQMLGGAVTVDGALGVLGFGNRLEFDLGTLLLRGRENFVLHPQLLFVAMAGFVVLFVYLRAVTNLVAQAGRIVIQRSSRNE